MAALIPFTSNYTDVSTYEGYQFEFRCQRCGNGYRSGFRHSVTGFGGRMASLGGSLLGGEIGSRVQEVGLLAQWDRSSTRGSTNDKRLLEASQDVAGHFVQCRGCTEWVCRDVCWDDRAGCCGQCMQQRASYGPPMMPPPMMPPPSVSLRHPGRPTAAAVYCPSCGSATSGRFCGSCGCPVAPPSCSGCGAPSQGTAFCTSCGTPAR